MKRIHLIVLLTALISFCSIAQKADTVVLKDGLYIKLPYPDGRKVIASDVISSMVETGKWKNPSENEALTDEGNIVGTWYKIKSEEDGWFRSDSLRNSYMYFSYKSDKDEIVLLEGMGHGTAYVNGLPHAGNPYCTRENYDYSGPRFDYSILPVKLQKGNNDLLFSCNRESVLKVKLHKGAKGLYFTEPDITVPDIIVDETTDTYGAIAVINASEEQLTGLFIKTWSGSAEPVYLPVKQFNPMSVLKTPFKIKLKPFKETGNIDLNIAIVKKGKEESVLVSTKIGLRIVKASDKHKETFISKLDGSVQYYAVTPPENLTCKPALFLSLHGAGVEAFNQANAYNYKNWGYIVCPTNRRPYGYNWENWGRQDALEVLGIALDKYKTDRNHTYLTGHSMGGHGTWQLGVNYPDKFAAIGPSAGWISIWSYRIRSTNDTSDVRKMLIRSTKQSDTYSFSTNLKPNGIYIIHGADDDNVPPRESKSMIENLSAFHKDFIYYEQPKAGHWWDNSDEPGADCVDWMPLFDFFAHHSVPAKENIKMVDFVTSNPAVTSSNYWIEILNQTEQLKLSSVKMTVETGNRKFIGTTSNIAKLRVDAAMFVNDKPVSINIDGQEIKNINIPEDKNIYLVKENNEWKVTSKPGEENKYPARCGIFKEVLNNNVVFVYGTKGDKEENKWAYEKARIDAERIWYQGNGKIEVISDAQFTAEEYKDRNVILFGNKKTNSAWNLLLADSPVQLENKSVVIGEKEYKGKDLALLMIRPRKDSKTASVAVIGGTGLEGMKLANLASFSNPWTSFPDLTVYNSEILKSDDAGIKYTGFFGNDWSIKNGEFVIK